eukprot:8868759-Pyramimonas_sp.AAC.1
MSSTGASSCSSESRALVSSTTAWPISPRPLGNQTSSGASALMCSRPPAWCALPARPRCCCPGDR